MKTTTTTRLRLELRDHWRIHERQIANAAWGGVFVVALLLISRMLQPAPVVLTVREPAIMILMTARPLPPLPTLTPWPVPTAVVIVEQAPAPPAEVIEVPVYVEVPAPPQAAQDGPGEAQAPAAEVQAAPTPEAPMYEVMTERQQNIQQHYANDRAPVAAPAADHAAADSPVQREWAAEQWRQEHCVGAVCTP
jgi:hypothetical protein